MTQSKTSKSPSTYSRLRAIGLMAAAKTSTRRAIEEKSVLRVFEAGTHIWKDGDPNVVVIQSGQCRLQIMSEGGQATTLAYLSDGDLAGLVERGAQNSVVSAYIATSCVSAMVISNEVLQSAFDEDIDLRKAMMDHVFNDAIVMRRRLFGMATLSVQARVASYVLDAALTSPSQSVVQTPQTHEEIASIVGATREAVTRTLRALVKQEIISYSREALKILNQPALKSLSKGG